MLLVPTLTAAVPFLMLFLPKPDSVRGWVAWGFVSAILQGAFAVLCTVVIFGWLHTPVTIVTVAVLLVWCFLNDARRLRGVRAELRAKRMAELVGDAVGILAGFAVAWLH